MEKLKLIAIFVLTLMFTASLGYADEVSFEVVPSSQVLNVGDTLTLTMKVRVFGMPDKLEAEPFSKLELPGFTTISTSPRHRRGIENGKEFEERITTFKLIAEEPGEHTIPSFQIPYTSELDSSRQYLTSQELAITVNPSSARSVEANALYIIGIFLLVVLLSVGGFYWWLRRVKSKTFVEEEDQNIQAKFAKWTEELQKLIASGKIDTFTQQAFNYVNEFIEDNYHLGLKGRKIEARLMIAKENNVDPSLIDLLKKTHANLEELKFGGITKDSPELTKLLEELKTIDQNIGIPKMK
jgi:hypothetical protein